MKIVYCLFSLLLITNHVFAQQMAVADKNSFSEIISSKRIDAFYKFINAEIDKSISKMKKNKDTNNVEILQSYRNDIKARIGTSKYLQSIVSSLFTDSEKIDKALVLFELCDLDDVQGIYLAIIKFNNKNCQCKCFIDAEGRQGEKNSNIYCQELISKYNSLIKHPISLLSSTDSGEFLFVGEFLKNKTDFEILTNLSFDDMKMIRRFMSKKK
jgi:hypothetical protein